ncbi:hypothetical protein LCGC14_2523420, partial [marine sediment metagenome]
HLQGLTVECQHFTVDDVVDYVCCDNTGTVPKYPCLHDKYYPVKVVDEVDLNDLLMDAAKRGHCAFEWQPPFIKGDLWEFNMDNRVQLQTEAATPIEAALVALARAEGQPDKVKADGN